MQIPEPNKCYSVDVYQNKQFTRLRIWVYITVIKKINRLIFKIIIGANNIKEEISKLENYVIYIYQKVGSLGKNK